MVQLRSQPWQRRLIIALLPFAAACGSSLKTQSINVTPVSALPAPAAPLQTSPLKIPS